jgi:hypothetical protein
MLMCRRTKNAKSGTSTESGKHTTINFSRQPGWLDICMLISRGKRLWMTCLQSCQGVACQTRLLWMSCQSCMEGVKTVHSQRRISKTCKSYVRFFCVWLQLIIMCVCKNFVSLQSLLLFCDWKKSMHNVLFCNYFMCVIANTDGNFMIAKKSLNSMWLQLFCVCGWNMTVSVWLKLLGYFGYLWLEAWIVCDCNSRFVVIAKRNWTVCLYNYFVCHYIHSHDNFVIAKKDWTVCLELFCVCDCNPNLFVVATWLCLCG